MKKVKLEDIAKACGVSTATVLRVVRNSGYVSQEKRILIEEAILRMGYVPRQKANPTVLEDAKIFAHFLHENAHPLFGRLSDGIGKMAMSYGYSIITQHVDEGFDAAEIMRMIERLRSYHIGGVILNSLADIIDFTPISRYLQTLPLPVVMIERVADIYNINKVLINAQEGMHLAVQHLTAFGHQRVVLFNAKQNTMVEASRIDGFLHAAQAQGIQEGALYVPTRNYSFAEGYRAISEYAAEHPLPTAIIASDSLLVGILQYLYEKGVRIPDEVSVVGLDDTFAQVVAPQLTSVAFPEKEMCDVTINLLLEQSGKKAGSSAKQILLSPYLNERGSVGKPREQEQTTEKQSLYRRGSTLYHH